MILLLVDLLKGILDMRLLPRSSHSGLPALRTGPTPMLPDHPGCDEWGSDEAGSAWTRGSHAYPTESTWWDLLHAPAISIRVIEKKAPDHIQRLSRTGWSIASGVEHLDFTDVHALLRKLIACCPHVTHH